MSYLNDEAAAKRSREHATKTLKPGRIKFVLLRLTRLRSKSLNMHGNKRIRADLDTLLALPQDTVDRAADELRKLGKTIDWKQPPE